MIKKQLISSFFSIIFITPLLSMKPNKTLQSIGDVSARFSSPLKEKKGIRFTSNFQDNYPYLVKNAYENKNFITYAAEQFVLNQDTAIKAMNDAKQRGADVYLTVGAHYQNKPDEYNVTSIKKDSTIHGKLTVGLDTSPSKKAPQKGMLLFGSANTTNSTWKHKPDKPGTQFNFESGIKIEDDMDLIPQAYSMVKNQSPIKSKEQKTTVLISPIKPSIYSSKDTNLNKSLALRLRDANKAFIRSMTFNNQDVADALSDLGPKAELIVDSSALTSTGIPLLQKIHDAQGSVHVFYPQEGSRTKQHAKDAIIEKNNKKTYINSTANITNEGDTQRNYQLYVPHNEQVVTDATQDFEKVKKVTIPFTEALQRKEIEKKRKLEQTNSKKQNKKQKTKK